MLKKIMMIVMCGMLQAQTCASDGKKWKKVEDCLYKSSRIADRISTAVTSEEQAALGIQLRTKMNRCMAMVPVQKKVAPTQKGAPACMRSYDVGTPEN